METHYQTMSSSLATIICLSLLISSSLAQSPPPSDSPFPPTSPDSPNSPFSPDSPNSPDSPFSPSSPDSPFPPSSPNSPFSPDSPNFPFSPDSPDPFSPFSPDSPFPPSSPDSPNSPFSPDSPNSPFSPDSPNSQFSPDSPDSPFSPNSPAQYIDTFDFVNDGPLMSTVAYMPGEYTLSYRVRQVTPSPDFVMTLGFYNTTPNEYTLALGVDSRLWVWAANPNDPVREGAKFSFKQDGNLVLVDFDGRLVWQSNTSNKGVVELSTPIDDQYGNMALYNSNHNVMWQSFDHPSDTLFANQYLTTKLVSRASPLGGYHSLVMMPHRLSFYYKSNSNTSKPVVYYTLFKTNKTLDRLQFLAYNQFKPSFNQHFTDGSQSRFEVVDLTPPPDFNYEILASFVRLENNGNLRVFIFQHDFEEEAQLWYSPYTLFKESGWSKGDQVDSCLLPEKCGAFGVCDNGVCVSCPTPQGLVPWTAGKCVPPTLAGCRPGKKAKYYKVDRVDHFSSKYNKGEGRTTLGLCQAKCDSDCKCVGYFFHLETSRCWIANDLMTLTKSDNPKHFGFVKISK